MLRGKAASFTATLLLACVPVLAGQGYEAGRGQDRSNNSAYQNSRSNRSYGNNGNQQSRHNQNFYNGVREGGRGGQYYDPRHATDGYDEGYYKRGGIGPGKAALIGGAGGAVLGAAVGGGLKGSLIGGAAGAGIGAVVGEAAQHRRDERR
jgi:hypothetical protein